MARLAMSATSIFTLRLSARPVIVAGNVTRPCSAVARQIAACLFRQLIGELDLAGETHRCRVEANVPRGGEHQVGGLELQIIGRGQATRNPERGAEARERLVGRTAGHRRPLAPGRRDHDVPDQAQLLDDAVDDVDSRRAASGFDRGSRIGAAAAEIDLP